MDLQLALNLRIDKMDITHAQALWVLGLLASDRLPEIALNAMENGVDSPSLEILASLIGSEITEAPKLFEQVLNELGLPVLSRRDAACNYAIAVSMQILNEELSPQDGANKLWDASIRVENSDFHELDTFIYAASELQSRPEDQEFFNNEILKEARIWASRDKN